MRVVRTSGLLSKDGDITFQLFIWIDVKKLCTADLLCKTNLIRFRTLYFDGFYCISELWHRTQSSTKCSLQFSYTYCVHIHQFIWVMEFIVASTSAHSIGYERISMEKSILSNACKGSVYWRWQRKSLANVWT